VTIESTACLALVEGYQKRMGMIGCNRVVQSASAGQEEHERKGDVKDAKEAGASGKGCSHPEEIFAHRPLSLACDCRQNLKELAWRNALQLQLAPGGCSLLNNNIYCIITEKH
jgi:hypothetical protein